MQDVINKMSYIIRCKTLAALLMAGLLMGCSTTSNLEDGEQLYTGLKPIEYTNYDNNQHFMVTQEEVEAALATAPNGALFGSSFYRTPFPYGLWIYNAFSQSNGAIPKWLSKTFGNPPVLMSNVNPELRVSVAENVLQNNGYFSSKVDYDIIEGKPKTTKTDSVPRPRTAKIAYKVDMGHLYTFDSIRYSNFTPHTASLLANSESLIKKDDAFSISTLDEERKRIYNLFRNHGYYYYNQSYTSYLADTLNTPGKVQLNMHLTDSLSEEAMMRWVIGKTEVKIRRSEAELFTDTINRRFLTVHFGGKRSPLRPRVILADMKMRPGQLFSQDAYDESLSNMVLKGIFSSANITFTPVLNEDGTYKTVPDSISNDANGEERAGAGILNMSVNCVLDKPYDFSLQANYLGKTTGRMGPGIGLGFAKRNAFRGGELLSLNVAANCEFQTGSTAATSTSNYEISTDVTVSFPRLWLPSFMTPKRRWYTTPSTIVSFARETINRSGFFRRHILSAELAYSFQPSAQSRHQFYPIILEYDRLAEKTAEYEKLQQASAVMMASSGNNFLAKMRYVYNYTSPRSKLNPIFFQIALTESSNLLSAGYLIGGKKWNTKGKDAFKIPYSQFLKLETEWRKTWLTSDFTTLVAHAQFGIATSFGNSSTIPFSESFYMDGANNMRAFAARSIGPGSYHNDNSKYQYVTNVGDMKFVMNLEYRPRIFGSLYGALFVDAGNIWNLKDDIILTEDDPNYHILGSGEGKKFKVQNMLKDLAVGVGVGIRYDLDFFVLRLDWGYAVHTPYTTGRSGYFNSPKFSNAQCLNFAIGYPF